MSLKYFRRVRGFPKGKRPPLGAASSALLVKMSPLDELDFEWTNLQNVSHTAPIMRRAALPRQASREHVVVLA